ncbi:uncharacterized protein, partial [Clytia hemisphaerica]
MNEIAVKCDECFTKMLCNQCDKQIHETLTLHNRTSIIDGYKRILMPSELVEENDVSNKGCPTVPLMPTNCQSCNSSKVERLPGDCVAVVTLSGKYYLHLFSLKCEDCQTTTNPFTLDSVIESGFWPSSPVKFSYLFKVGVFRFWDTLRKNAPGTSEAAFVEVLNTMRAFHGRENMGKITPTIFSTSFKEWCFCQHQIERIQKKNWMQCPSCTFDQHSCHVDGNCKLYRYRSSRRRTRKEFYNGLFIAEDKKVGSFINEIYKGKFGKVEADYICGGKWNAARNNARKYKSLDTTGLEVMSCRHQLGQRALNMKQGELYGYPLYLIKEHINTRDIKFVFADVMCKLSKFIQRVDAETAKAFKGALSVMHAKGHGIDCQFLWDGQWIDGTGRSTGEETEQVFSFLSRFCNTTKYQKPENREETLTEMILHWNRKKVENLARYLVKKYNTVKQDQLKYQTEIEKALNKVEMIPESVDFEMIKREIRDIAAKIAVPTNFQLSTYEKSVLLYQDMKTELYDNDEFLDLRKSCPVLPD